MQIKIPILYNSSQVTRNSVIKEKKKICDKEKEQEISPRNFCKEEIILFPLTEEHNGGWRD